VKLDVCFTPNELSGVDLSKKTVVVIDVLRATSTIVCALAAGARSVFPVASIEEAVRLAQVLGREDALLAGERKSLRIEGFDLGNSPSEFTPERVEGKHLVMNTTNGTVALLAAAGAGHVLVGALVNLDAVARAVAELGKDAVALCAGREQRFAVEDAVCAGLLFQRVRALKKGARYGGDAAVTAQLLASHYATSVPLVLSKSAAGRQLARAGLGADLQTCADMDRLAIVPQFRDKQVTL
jgi:2-phosphosulfolactate phosphatase